MYKRSSLIPALLAVAFLSSCTHRQALTTPEAEAEPIPNAEELETADLAPAEPVFEEVLPEAPATEPVTEPAATAVAENDVEQGYGAALASASGSSGEPKVKPKRKARPAKVAKISRKGRGYQAGQKALATVAAIAEEPVQREPASVDVPVPVVVPTLTPEEQPGAVAATTTTTVTETPEVVEAGWPLWATLAIFAGVFILGYNFVRGRRARHYSYHN